MHNKEDKKSVEQLLAEVDSYFSRAAYHLKEKNKKKMQDFLNRIKKHSVWGDQCICPECERKRNESF